MIGVLRELSLCLGFGIFISPRAPKIFRWSKLCVRPYSCSKGEGVLVAVAIRLRKKIAVITAFAQNRSLRLLHGALCALSQSWFGSCIQLYHFVLECISQTTRILHQLNVYSQLMFCWRVHCHCHSGRLWVYNPFTSGDAWVVRWFSGEFHPSIAVEYPTRMK